MPMPEPKLVESSAPTVTVVGKTIHVTWNKCVFRIGDYGVNLTVGPFSVSDTIPDGADRIVIGAKLLKECKMLADTAFAEQLAWYASRLGLIQKKLESA